MTLLRAASVRGPEPTPSAEPPRYVPGVCNIGPYEIARRRRSGLVGFAVAIAVAAVLLVLDVPNPVRGLVLLPLWAAFTTSLQAVRRFCVGFAVAGLENLGEDAAARRRVVDEDARAADRRAGRRLVLEGFLYAAPIAALFVLLPV